MTAQRWGRFLLVGLLLLGGASCTESDEQLVDNVGVTVLILVDSGLSPQNVNALDTLQVAEWLVIPEDAALGKTQLDFGGALIDPLFGEPCTYADTVRVPGSAAGPCSSGVSIEATGTPTEVTATLIIERASVRRGEPKVKPTPPLATGDSDDEGDYDLTPNVEDNCPWLYNYNQEETILDGIGDACVVRDFFLGYVRDSDGDNVADVNDNCVWEPNFNQADTEGLGAQGIADGIGDVCRESAAQVLGIHTASADGKIRIDTGPLTLIQGVGQFNYLTVDFNGALTSCDWSVGTCNLNEHAVKFCVHTSIQTAQFGC